MTNHLSHKEVLEKHVPGLLILSPFDLVDLCTALDAFAKQDAIKFAKFMASGGFDFDFMGGYIEFEKDCPLPFAHEITEEQMYALYKLQDSSMN